MPEKDIDLFEEDIAAYVLGALDVDEAEAMKEHLVGCERCRSIEARLRQATTLLPLAALEVEPPPDLRDRILTAATGAPIAPPTRRRSQLRPVRLGVLGSWFARPAAAALAVLVLAVAGLGAWNASLEAQLRQAHTALASRPIKPASTAMAEASGRALVLSNERLVVVTFKNMPSLAPGQVYELWLGSQGTFIPAGVFRPEADGSKQLVVKEGTSSYTVIALTVEPGPNGTSTPTQAPGMSGSL